MTKAVFPKAAFDTLRLSMVTILVLTIAHMRMSFVDKIQIDNIEDGCYCHCGGFVVAVDGVGPDDPCFASL